MLNGVNKLNLDAKGRLAIPSRYRTRLMDVCAGHLIVTLDQEKKVVIYPHNEWLEVEKKLVALPMSPAAIKVKRLYLGHAIDCDMDKNGRINLPPYLREIAGLEKQIALVGLTNKFEVWDDAAWEAEMLDDDELDLSSVLEDMAL